MKLNEIRNITDNGNFHTVFFYNKPAVNLFDKLEASDLISKLRVFKSVNENPENRIIDGIDNVDENNLFSYQQELDSIEKTITIQESRKYKPLTVDKIDFLFELTEMRKSNEIYVNQFTENIKKIINLINQNETFLMADEFSPENADALKTMMSQFEIVHNANDKFNNALLSILDDHLQKI